MFKLVSLLLVFSGFDLLFGQECSLMLKPDMQTVLVTKGNDISIVCNASCYGPLSSNQIGWFDRHNRRVPSGGRVFSVSYNRGMYSRLILLNADVQDMGRYACVGRIGKEVVRKDINLNVIDRDAHIVEFVVEEEGPRRGDVRIEEPHLPNRRPVRDVQLRDILRRVRREDPSSPNPTKDTSAETSTETSSNSKIGDTSSDSTIHTSSDSTIDTSSSFSVPGSTPEMITSINTNTTTNTSTPNNLNTASNGNTDTSNSPLVTYASSIDGSGDVSTGTTSMTDKSSSKKDEQVGSTAGKTKASTPSHTSKSTSTNSANDGSSRKSGLREGEGEGEEEGEETTTTVEHGPEARTAFGKYGVLAFALALSAAILLLYTLILLNVILPRCCWKKRSVSFKDESAHKPKETGPSAVDFVALKPLNVESCPNSPDHGFTTVDLDDKPDGAKKDEKQNGTPASPSSSTEPQSPSKFVTTFTIGRKPSTTDPSGVYVHEGKQEVVPALSEEGVAADTEDGQKSAKSADDHKADDIFASSDAKKDVENDLDTSKEADTSTDSNTDTSGS